MSKYKVMFLIADNAGCGYARIKQPVKYMEKKYSDLFEFESRTKLAKENYLNADNTKKVDLVVCQRQLIPAVLAHVNLMVKSGIKIIYEIDDALDKISMFSSAYKAFKDNPQYLPTMLKFMEASDAITVSTDYLKSHYKADYVLPNSIDFDIWDKIEKKDNGETIVIGWAGSSTHYADIKECADAVEAVALKYPQVKIALGGWDAKEMRQYIESPRGTFPMEIEYTSPKTNTITKVKLIKDIKEIRALEGKYYTLKDGNLTFLKLEEPAEIMREQFPKVNLDEFITLRNRSVMSGVQYYETGSRYFFNKLPDDKIIYLPWVTEVERLGDILKHFDIGIAPLEDTVFNSSKSNIKYLEYSAMGIPTVASKVTPYADTIVNGETGFLIKTKGSVYLDWVKALSRLVESNELRESIGKKANSFVRENFNMEKNADLWKDAYLKVLENQDAKN